MKNWPVLALLLISFPGFPQGKNQNPQSLENIIAPITFTLHNPVLPQASCEDMSVPQCQIISNSVCVIETPGEGLALVRENVRRPFLNKGSVPEDDQTMMALFRASEEEIFRRIPVTREQMSAHVDEVRNQLINMVSNERSIPEATRTQMMDKLRQTTFAMPSQYVEEVTQSLIQAGRTPQDARFRAVRDVRRMCDDGFNENAFNNRNHLVFCPGLLYQFARAGASSSERFLTAMNFTIGHELGHSIGPSTFPDVYQDMGRCYDRISGDSSYWNGRKGEEGRAEETSADFWGSRVFALRMQQQNLQGQYGLIDLRRTTDGFCRMDADNQYDSGRNRIDLTITRDPVIWQQIGCTDLGVRQGERCGLSP